MEIFNLLCKGIKDFVKSNSDFVCEFMFHGKKEMKGMVCLYFQNIFSMYLAFACFSNFTLYRVSFAAMTQSNGTQNNKPNNNLKYIIMSLTCSTVALRI